MGSCNVELEMPGTPSFSAIDKRIKDQRNEDRDYSGHQEGYSGDFQTIHDVKDHTHKTFDSYNEAQRYCLDNCEKREAVAVRYRFIDAKAFKFSAKIEKLQGKVLELNEQLRKLEAIPVKLPAFKTCEGCGSKVATAHLRNGSTDCPVCGEGDFRPLSMQRSEVKVKGHIKLAQELLEKQKKSEREKGLKKYGKVGTLVAGWGAC